MDSSQSIDASEYERCRQRIEKIIAQLDRGDRLVLVPITGEPAEILGRRIRTVEMPRDYAPYDSNLKQARGAAARTIEQFAVELAGIRAARSNILGAVRASADYIRDDRTTIVCLSDLVEDEAALQFRTAAELNDQTTAEHLAERLAGRGELKGAEVKLVLLRSSELERLSPERCAAVRAFWQRYLLASGARSVEITVDIDALASSVSR